MTKQCPNCDTVFEERYEDCFKCVHCGWFREIDGKWRSCPEPVKITEPDPKVLNVPAPHEPIPPEPDKIKSEIPTNRDRLESNVREYLGGLITVETEDDENGS